MKTKTTNLAANMMVSITVILLAMPYGAAELETQGHNVYEADCDRETDSSTGWGVEVCIEVWSEPASDCFILGTSAAWCFVRWQSSADPLGPNPKSANVEDMKGNTATCLSNVVSNTCPAETIEYSTRLFVDDAQAFWADGEGGQWPDGIRETERTEQFIICMEEAGPIHCN